MTFDGTRAIVFGVDLPTPQGVTASPFAWNAPETREQLRPELEDALISLRHRRQTLVDRYRTAVQAGDASAAIDAAHTINATDATISRLVAAQ